MKKLFTLISILAVLMLASVFAAGQVAIGSVTNPSAVNPGATATVSIQIKNIGDADISGVILTQSDILSGTTVSIPSSSITVNPISLGTLTNVTSQTVTLSVPVPATLKPGVYTGKLNVVDMSNSTNLDIASYTVSVNPAPALTITAADLTFQGAPGATTMQKTFTIKNTGNVDLTNLLVNHTISNLKDSNGNAVTLQFSETTISSLAIGATKDIIATVTIPSAMQVVTFAGEVAVKVTSGTTNLDVRTPLSIKILPLACTNAPSSKVDVVIDTPSSGDDFEPGETINVNAIVHNRDSSNKRFIVEAYLYNVDNSKKVESYKSSDKNIDGNDELSYRFTLKMDNNLDDGDDYRIFMKVYERSNEENVCNQQYTTINLEVPEDKVVINSFSVSPTTLTCSETSDALVQLSNLGLNDESVKVRLVNTYLEVSNEQIINLKSVTDENTANVRASFSIPKNVKDGSYKVRAEITYAGLTDYTEQTITVKGCQPITQVAPQNNNQVNLPNAVPLTNQQTKDIFELFNSAIETPTAFWLLVDALLVLAIFAALVGIFRVSGRRR